MSLTNSEVEAFKQIALKQYGLRLSDADAREHAERLVALATKVLDHKIKKEQEPP